MQLYYFKSPFTSSAYWLCARVCIAKRREDRPQRAHMRSFTVQSASATKRDRSTPDTDVTSGMSVTSLAPSSRVHKKRQLVGTETETDIMNKMLYVATKPPLPSSLSARQERRLDESTAASDHLEPVSNSRGNAVSEDAAEVSRTDGKSDSDVESNASAGTYTVDADEKGDLKEERARIDVAFGIPSSDGDRSGQASTDDDNAHLHVDGAQIDDDVDDCLLQIQEDSDQPVQPRLKRAKHQTLFPKYVDDSSPSNDASLSHSPFGRNGTAINDEIKADVWKSSRGNGTAVPDRSEVAFGGRESFLDAENTAAVTTEHSAVNFKHNITSICGNDDDDVDDDDDDGALAPTNNQHEVHAHAHELVISIYRVAQKSKPL